MTVNSCFTVAMSLSEVRAEASPRARIRELFASLSRAALDALYPPICLACRAATGAHGGLCPSCWRAMRFIERPFCDRLGTPFEQDLGEGLLSPQAIADPPVFRRARAVARFEDGPARRLVHRLKYSDRGDLARPLGAWMARAGADVLADADAIVPVPLHPLRLWKRRFNQAAALAQAVAAESGKPFEPRWLLRVKSTRSQVGLTREQRAANMQGAFRAAPGAPLRGLRIVARRRRPHLRRHRQRRRAGAAARRRRRRRPDRVRPGCDGGVTPHILRSRPAPRRERTKILPPIVIYTKSTCSYCRAAKDLLRRKGATFEEISVDGDRAAQAAMAVKAGGRSTVPQIFVGATHVGGCDDLYDLESAGELDALLAG